MRKVQMSGSGASSPVRIGGRLHRDILCPETSDVAEGADMTGGGAKKILFFSGSVGLGHVTRDLAIADALRRRIPEIEIHWLAAPPANQVIRDAGESLEPEAVYDSLDEVAQHLLKGCPA